MNLELVAGRAATARKQYLVYHNPNEYKRMEQAGELNAHLELIGKQAADHYATLMAQLRQQAEEAGRTFNYGQSAGMAWEMTLAEIVNV